MNHAKMNIPVQDKKSIEKIKQRLTDFFNNKPIDRLPFFFTKSNYEKISIEKLTENEKNLSRQIKDHKLNLNEQLKMFQQKLELNTKYEDDTILSLGPFTGVGTIASAFACQTKFPDNALPWTEHIFEDPKDILHLKPDINKAELFNLALEKALYFRDEIGDSIPIRLPDIQCPLGTAGIVMKDTALFEAVYTNPEEIHLLLKIITETLIKMVRIFEEKIGNLFCYSHASVWLPHGIHMSDDFLPVVSQNIYEEFSKPYNEIIAKEFGGVFLHSCGNYLHQVPNLLNTKGILGVDFKEFSIKDMLEKNNDKFIINSGYVEDPYMNFAVKFSVSNEEIINRNLRDLDKLKFLKTKNLIFQGNCLDESYADEYYKRMVTYLTELAKKRGGGE